MVGSVGDRSKTAKVKISVLNVEASESNLIPAKGEDYDTGLNMW